MTSNEADYRILSIYLRELLIFSLILQGDCSNFANNNN
jgi:hypothetical protein